MEVSMPTGSLCAERNVIGSAFADDVTLRRRDLKLIAVYSALPPKRPSVPSLASFALPPLSALQSSRKDSIESTDSLPFSVGGATGGGEGSTPLSHYSDGSGAGAVPRSPSVGQTRKIMNLVLPAAAGQDRGTEEGAADKLPAFTVPKSRALQRSRSLGAAEGEQLGPPLKRKAQSPTGSDLPRDMTPSNGNSASNGSGTMSSKIKKDVAFFALPSPEIAPPSPYVHSSHFPSDEKISSSSKEGASKGRLATSSSCDEEEEDGEELFCRPVAAGLGSAEVTTIEIDEK